MGHEYEHCVLRRIFALLLLQMGGAMVARNGCTRAGHSFSIKNIRRYYIRNDENFPHWGGGGAGGGGFENQGARDLCHLQDLNEILLIILA